MGIDKYIGEALPIVQASVTSAQEDTEGRARAVTFLKRLMAEIVCWL